MSILLEPPYFRFDLFLTNNPTTPLFFNNPHDPIIIPKSSFLLLPEGRDASNVATFEAQEEIAVFFASDGVEGIDPDGPGTLFETPIVPPYPKR